MAAKHWQIAGLVILFIFCKTTASQPIPPQLPVPLPDGIQVTDSLTSWEPAQFMHRAILNRPLDSTEQQEFANRLAAHGWQSTSLDPSTQQETLLHLTKFIGETAGPSPFDWLTRIHAGGAQIWTLPPIQLLYLPLERPVLLLTFPFTEEVPLEQTAPGLFTFHIQLPLLDARFQQRILQRQPGALTATEQWEAQLTPYLMDLIENQLLSSGCLPMNIGLPAESAPALPGGNPFQNLIRAYQKEDQQLTILRLPTSDNPGLHTAIFISRWVFPAEFLHLP